jgi:hypothetical protein
MMLALRGQGAEVYSDDFTVWIAAVGTETKRRRSWRCEESQAIRNRRSSIISNNSMTGRLGVVVLPKVERK